MPDIQKLADNALTKLRAGDAISFVDAARKAVIGGGITNKFEVKKFSRQIVRELGKRGGYSATNTAKAKRVSREISKKISG